MTRPPETLTLPTYRADIDGLRAVAVLLVLAFHFDLVSGGSPDLRISAIVDAGFSVIADGVSE